MHPKATLMDPKDYRNEPRIFPKHPLGKRSKTWAKRCPLWLSDETGSKTCAKRCPLWLSGVPGAEFSGFHFPHLGTLIVFRWAAPCLIPSSTFWSVWSVGFRPRCLLMAPLRHKGTIALRSPNNNNKTNLWKMHILVLERFKGLVGLGECGKHWKCIQFRACNIWCKSVRTTPISRPTYFLEHFEKVVLGLSASRAPAAGPLHYVFRCRQSWNIDVGMKQSNQRNISYILFISSYTTNIFNYDIFNLVGHFHAAPRRNIKHRNQYVSKRGIYSRRLFQL